LIKTGKKSWLARKIDQNEAYRLGRIELFDEKIINEKTKEKYDFELKISEKNNNDFKIPISEENKPDFIPNLNKDECSSLKNNKLEIKKLKEGKGGKENKNKKRKKEKRKINIRRSYRYKFLWKKEYTKKIKKYWLFFLLLAKEFSPKYLTFSKN